LETGFFIGAKGGMFRFFRGEEVVRDRIDNLKKEGKAS